MAATAGTAENVVSEEQSLGEPIDTNADKPQKLKKSKAKVGKAAAIHLHIEEQKVKPRTKTAPIGKSHKKVRIAKKLVGQGRNHNLQPKKRPQSGRKFAGTRKGNARYRGKKKSPWNLYINGGPGSMSNHFGRYQPCPIPLEVPSARPRGSARSSIKYTLTRVVPNRVHPMSVWTNQSRFRRHNRTTMHKKHARRKYFVDFWREPGVKLDDLSSLDCGSYSNHVEELSTIEDAGKFEDLLSATVPTDFVFNVNAPEFISKKKSNIFTVNELLESLVGQQLPSMPDLRHPHL